jgi:hypothetical protein
MEEADEVSPMKVRMTFVRRLRKSIRHASWKLQMPVATVHKLLGKRMYLRAETLGEAAATQFLPMTRLNLPAETSAFRQMSNFPTRPLFMSLVL